MGEHAFRLALVRRQWLRYNLQEIETITYPDDVSGWPGRISSALAHVRQFVQKRGLKRLPLNVALIGDEIAFRRLYLPLMPPRELERAMVWEGQKLFPFDLTQCLISHEVVSRVPQENAPLVGVNLVAAKKEVVSALYESAKEHALNLRQVNYLPEYLTLLPAGKAAASPTDRVMILLLDSIASAAVFVTNGAVEFVQHFAASLGEFSAGEGSSPRLDGFLTELQTFIDLYSAHSRGEAPDVIYCCGDLAGTPGLDGLISRSMALPCSLLSAGLRQSDFFGLKASELDRYPDAVLTALAPNYHYPLAPPSIRRSMEHRRMALQVGTATALAAVCIGGLCIVQHHHRDMVQKELHVKQEALNRIENSEAYQTYLRLIESMARGRQALAASQDQPRSQCHILLQELSRNLSENVSLAAIQLSVENNVPILYLDGAIEIANFSPEIILAEYIAGLERSNLIENVRVLSHRKEHLAGGFKLSFQLKMGVQV